MGSLPNIFNEIWEVMGETGKAIRQSILWVVETVSVNRKNYENNLCNSKILDIY